MIQYLKTRTLGKRLILSASTLTIFALAIGVLSCASRPNLDGEKTQISSQDQGQIAPLMQGFKQNLKGLIPYLYSQKRFTDPAHTKDIEKYLQALNDRADEVASLKSTKIAQKDPSLKFAADELKNNIHLSYESFKEGHKGFAQGALREAVQQCVYCHSRNSTGPQWGYDSSDNKLTEGMSPTDKADFFVAMREFDAARTTLAEFFKKPADASMSPIDLESTAKKWLALEIRVEGKPKGVERALKTIDKQKNKPENMKSMVSTWKQSLARWKREKKALKSLEDAQNLIAIKDVSRKLTVRTEATDLDFIRATGIIHNYLESQRPSPTDKARALYLLGLSYERMRDLGFWNLSDYYFESCVRTSPHTEIAQSCYQEWDDAIVSGYSGSAGTFIPSEVESRRQSLKKLAQ